MSVRLRLTRIGGRKDPVWRVVVADQRSPRDGRVIETVGRYNAQTHPSEIVLDRERVRHWLARGAQPSETVTKLLRAEGLSANGADLPGRPRTPVEAPPPGDQETASGTGLDTADPAGPDREGPTVDLEGTPAPEASAAEGPEGGAAPTGGEPAAADASPEAPSS